MVMHRALPNSKSYGSRFREPERSVNGTTGQGQFRKQTRWSFWVNRDREDRAEGWITPFGAGRSVRERSSFQSDAQALTDVIGATSLSTCQNCMFRCGVQSCPKPRGLGVLPRRREPAA
jgi:hypothetical protein